MGIDLKSREQKCFAYLRFKHILDSFFLFSFFTFLFDVTDELKKIIIKIGFDLLSGFF